MCCMQLAGLNKIILKWVSILVLLKVFVCDVIIGCHIRDVAHCVKSEDVAYSHHENLYERVSGQLNAPTTLHTEKVTHV